jgi:hypothetical protein
MLFAPVSCVRTLRVPKSRLIANRTPLSIETIVVFMQTIFAHPRFARTPILARNSDCSKAIGLPPHGLSFSSQSQTKPEDLWESPSSQFSIYGLGALGFYSFP